MGDASGQRDPTRREERFDVVGVRGSLVVSADGRVTNLGLDGLGLETETPLQVGRRYFLKLVRPDQELRVEGKVVWCSLVRTEPGDSDEVVAVYRAGIRFHGTLTPLGERLSGFLREHSVASLEKRRFGRFRLAQDKAATVGAEAAFVVRQMSLSGMLIETDLGLRVGTEYPMEIRLRDVAFAVTARVVRAERVEETPPEGPRAHRLGVEFVGIDDAARAALEELRGQRSEGSLT